MNNFTGVVLVSWETRSWRHSEKARLYCRNYGLKPVLKNAYIGKLYSRERSMLERLLAELFVKKTERFFMGSLCKSCYETSRFSGTMIRNMKKEIDHEPDFELVQIEADSLFRQKKQ